MSAALKIGRDKRPAAEPKIARKPLAIRSAAKLEVVTPPRRKAIVDAKPNMVAPSVQLIRQGAIVDTGSMKPSPSDEPHPAEMPERDRANSGAKPNLPPPGLDLTHAAIVTELVQLQRLRKFCIKSQSRCDRSIESLIASSMGFRLDADEKDRKKVFAQAKAYRLSVEGGKGHEMRDTQPRGALSALNPIIVRNAQSRAGWDDQRKTAETEMERLAKQLPVWPFVETVKGLGAKGLAVIVGEAGIPLGDYRTISGLWKRMGLAVINGERQRKKANVEEAAEHGYSPGRRAEIWAFCSDTMFRQQWRGADEESGLLARPVGPYGEVYARRRANTDPRIEATIALPAGDPAKWTKGRCHNDGRRVMTKALLADLWVEWRRHASP
jgi:hypothetical protein